MSQTYINQLKNHISESKTRNSWNFVILAVAVMVLGCVGCISEGTGASIHTDITPQQTPETVERKSDTEREPTMPILKEIAKYKKANPLALGHDLAGRGNELLPAMGFEFDIDLGEIITKSLKSKKLRRVKKDGDDSEYFYLTIPLVTETGKKTAVTVVAPMSESCCCGYTYTPIPLTQISSERLAVVIDGKPTVIKRTKNLPVVQEYILYENEKAPKKIRSWEAPFETYPYGLSTDGKSVYFETDIKELLLVISAEGNFGGCCEYDFLKA